MRIATSNRTVGHYLNYRELPVNLQDWLSWFQGVGGTCCVQRSMLSTTWFLLHIAEKMNRKSVLRIPSLSFSDQSSTDKDSRFAQRICALERTWSLYLDKQYIHTYTHTSHTYDWVGWICCCRSVGNESSLHLCTKLGAEFPLSHFQHVK